MRARRDGVYSHVGKQHTEERQEQQVRWKQGRAEAKQTRREQEREEEGECRGRANGWKKKVQGGDVA